MPYEKPGEAFPWKIELDDLDHLPEEQVLDKTRAWEKLPGRLLKKPGNTIIRWYWTAAACLLLSVGIPWLTMNEKDNNLVKNTRQQIPGNPSILQTPPTNNTITPPQTQIDPKRPVPAKAKIKQQLLPANKKVEINTSVLDQTKLSIGIIPEVKNISINPDTIAFVTAIPEKKKLRVVHINELDNPEEHIPFARSNASPAFQVKSLNDDAFSVFAVSRNSSDNILKIMLSPSN